MFRGASTARRGRKAERAPLSRAKLVEQQMIWRTCGHFATLRLGTGRARSAASRPAARPRRNTTGPAVAATDQLGRRVAPLGS